LHHAAVFWGHAVITLSPVWKHKIKGQENIVPGHRYVIVTNHQSLIDIIVVLASLPLHFKFMAKQELYAVPFVGWHMALAGYIPIMRTSRESGRKAMDLAHQWLRKGVSVLFFPEGTRSLNGQIHDFKMGAFKVAQEEDVEILPVVIEGTGDVIPKKSWRVKKLTRFDVSIGRPVRIQRNRPDALAKVRDSVRSEMIGRLDKVRRKNEQF